MHSTLHHSLDGSELATQGACLQGAGNPEGEECTTRGARRARTLSSLQLSQPEVLPLERIPLNSAEVTCVPLCVQQEDAVKFEGLSRR